VVAGLWRVVFDVVGGFDFMGSLPCHPSRIRSVTERRGRPGGGVKALRRVWAGESDHWAIAPVHKKSCLSFSRHSGRDDVRGVGDASCAVRAHRFALFYSRFCSRFQVSLHHTHSGRIAHRFNAHIVHGLTPSHSLPVPTDRPVQAKTEPCTQVSLRVRLPEAHTQPRSN
jgi:hypothetical protein